MAVTLEIGVLYLRAKLFAHTFVFGFLPYPTRTISAFCFQSFDHSLYNFFIFVKPYFHFSFNFPYRYAVTQTITTAKEVVNTGILLIVVITHIADIKNITDKIVCIFSPVFSFLFETKTEIERATPTIAAIPNTPHVNAFP